MIYLLHATHKCFGIHHWRNRVDMKSLLANTERRLACSLIRQISVRDQYEIDRPFGLDGVDLLLNPRRIDEIANYRTHI